MDVPIFGVIVGLTFILLLFSVLASHLTEIVAGFTGLRGEVLYAAVDQMFQSAAFRNRIYQHPLIKSVSVDQNKFATVAWPLRRMRAVRKKKPSYIAPEIFALVVMDLGIELTEQRRDAPGETRIKTGLDNNAETILQTLVGNTFGNATAVQTILQRWYTDCMNRVTGTYKRTIFPLLLLASVLVTSAFDVDVIRVAGRLYYDPSLRAVTAQQAQAYASGGQSSSGVDDELSRLQIPLGWRSVSDAGEAGATVSTSANTEPLQVDGVRYFRSHKVLACIGLVFTSLLLSLGAPFWFDIANKVVNLRGAGASPASRPPQLVSKQ